MVGGAAVEGLEEGSVGSGTVSERLDLFDLPADEEE